MTPASVQDVQACNRCRAAKRRCDKIQPVCSRCDSASATCIYTTESSCTGILARSTCDSASTVRIVKRRARASLSCTRCHRLKVKCDQNTPCGRCERSNSGLTCIYDHRARIVGATAVSSFPLTDEDPEFVVATWFLRRRGSSHFKALLDRLESLSALDAPPFTLAMREHIIGDCSTDFSLSGNFPLGSPESRPYMSLDRIQELLRTHSANADAYIARYFAVYHQSMPVMDPSTFHTKVRAFRDVPTEADASWLAQYLVILGLGAYATNRDEVACAELFYASEACLARTPYMFRPTTTNISTLCLMVLAKEIAYATCWALDTCWNLMGLIVRLSMMMMLYQEWMPQFDEPAIETERELRRRLWIVVVYLDIQMSLITGQQSLLPQDVLPMSTESRELTTLEECFHTLLPKSFPVICRFLARINSNVNSVTYEDVLQYDNELRHLMSLFAPLPGLDAIRLALDLFFRRALSVLHGRHALGTSAPHLYPRSYFTSLECNLAMLAHHRNMAESPEQISDITLIVRPYMLDFFAAALTTCVHLLGHDASAATAYELDLSVLDTTVLPRQTMLNSLSDSVELFGKAESKSLCFRTGYGLLSAVYGLIYRQ